VRIQRKEVGLLERPQTDQPRTIGQLRRWAPLSRAHKALFLSTSAFYLVVILAVLTTSKVVTFDWYVMMFKPYEHWPALNDFLNVYVVAGQRGPSAIVVALWLGWRSWRSRSMRPLLVLGVSLVLLNMSVGAVKIGMGRLGPHYAHVAGSSELFLGGGIFPSGHTANAVVTWGAIAYLAVRRRRTGAFLAGFMGLSIGFTTVYLGTHWVTDVLAGWAAGVLVLLALPLFEPVIMSADARIQLAWGDRHALLARLPGRLGVLGSALAARQDPTTDGVGAVLGTRSGSLPGTTDASTRSTVRRSSGSHVVASGGSVPAPAGPALPTLPLPRKDGERRTDALTSPRAKSIT
jgi:membrane-associated phospholipid phosphatase